jgi:hypothetical protein
MRRVPKIVHVFKFLVLGIIFCAAIGFAIQHLWNWLMPAIFALPLITFWQALGLFLLGKLLLGWHGGGAPWKEKARQKWRNKMKERMENMTEEQREEMRERFRKCGGMDRWDRWDKWDPCKPKPKAEDDTQSENKL